MFVPFENMTPTARVWIYQSDRRLSDEEVELTEAKMRDFLDQWAAHGQGLKCSGTVRHGYFLVLSVDQNHHAASGCSIDSSVNFVKGLGQLMQIDWFNRLNVAFKSNDKIQLGNRRLILEKIESGEIDSETPVFNNLVGTIGEMQDHWVIPARESWINRLFAKKAI